jgi:tricorn protease
MRQFILSLVLILITVTVLVAQPAEVYFAGMPTLSPDCRFIIFNYQGDLWKVNTEGGTATRLTGMRGDETRPRISPDGKWLAFTANQFGSEDIYVMPLDGGGARQLTFHEAYEQVDSWSWDSKKIYFTSNQYNQMSTYTVNIGGGTPVRLFDHFFNRIHNAVEHPATGEIFFNDTWESRSAANRKHYKGAYHPKIQSYNPATKEYKLYSDYIGKEFWVTIDRSGKIYFVSDEANGEYNLYTFENGRKVQLTDFKTSIKYPQVSADGKKVVFEKDYQLYLYDVASKTSAKIDIRAFPNSTIERESDYNVQGNIVAFDVSPDGKKIAFSSRGMLFVSDIGGKFIQPVAAGSHERVMEVKWLSDNKRLIFNRTTKGYLNWFVASGDGSGVEKQLTDDSQDNRNLTLNKDRTLGVFFRGRNDVQVVDLKTFDVSTAVKDEIWAFDNPLPYFSPNSEYILFSAYRNFESDIFIHRLKDKKTINLTKTGVTETSPFWSPDGKYIYFATNRTTPSYPFGLADSKIYRLALDRFDKPYKSDKFADLFKTADTTKKKEDKKDEKKKDESIVISLDTVDIVSRWEKISPDFGSQDNPYVIQKDSTTTIVVYTSNHSEGKNLIWKTTLLQFDPPKTEMVSSTETDGLAICVSDGKYYTLIKGSVYKLDVDGNKADKIDINYTFRKNLKSEFTQMFAELWANLEENYYDKEFHGVDWKGVRERYQRYLPYLASRSEMRILFNDMLGELNSSHLGFTSSGKEEDLFYSNRSLAFGLIFENDNPYRVKSIVKHSATDVKGVDVLPGDLLKKVNGVSVDPTNNRESYLMKPSLDDEIKLTFDRNGKEFDVKLHPQSFQVMKDEVYDEWIEWNRHVVDSISKNRITYIYMKDMGGGSLEQFLIKMTSDAYVKDGLILDLRYNTGGNVHDQVLRFLSQRPYMNWKYRDGALTPQSNFTPADKPMVLLVNEQSLSDAEVTANGFKQLGLGKIVGTETYRWIIFTSGKTLVDGSYYRLPSWGCYRLDGKDIEKEGVKPDILIETMFTDRIANKDPQLEKAVQVVMEQLKK